jgi:hypothetical protein
MLKKRTLQKNIAFILALLILVSACRAPEQVAAPTLDLNALYTQVAGTLIAQGQQGATATTAPTDTPVVVTSTSSPTPSLPSATPTNTAPPATSVPVAVCNQAAFVSDVTVKDGTVMDPEEEFTKTWRIKNVGTCTWDEDYTVVYSHGTNLAAKASYDLPEDVSPGETIDISINMEAPTANGTYTSNWLLRSDGGSTFGVGGSGNNSGVPFFVVIKVTKGSGDSGSDTDVIYDLASDYCDADWSSDEDNNLPCPGANSGNDGFVIRLSNPDLENRQEDEPAIWMRPNHDNNGYIQGVFPDLDIKDGYHFTATIGCLDNNDDCEVQFTLVVIKENGDEDTLGSWAEASDGLVREVDVDLSAFKGDEINLVLIVEPNNNDFSEANAFWFVPQVVK